MTREQGKDPVKRKRFFVQGDPEVHKRLQHLAIDLGTSAEKLAGDMLTAFIDRVEADAKAGKWKSAK